MAIGTGLRTRYVSADDGRDAAVDYTMRRPTAAALSPDAELGLRGSDHRL
jgi:hypothetical protein